MTLISKNSYQESVFNDFSSEKKRLTEQAKIMHQFELELLKRQGLKASNQVLDLGCGNGFLTYAIAEFLESGSISGVDLNEEFINEAKKKFLKPNLIYDVSSAYHLNLSRSFDFIFSRLLFQHLEKPAEVISQIKHHLKPGGRCCIIDVNDEWLFIEPSIPEFNQLIQLFITKQRQQGGNRLIGRTLVSLLKASGFNNIKIEIVPFSSELVGMDKFLEIGVSFRANQVDDDTSLTELYQKVQDTITKNSSHYFGLLGIFCVSAELPSIN